MILYLDTSALAKQYIRETESAQVAAWIDEAALVGTSLVARAEMEAVLGRLRRMEALAEAAAMQALATFRRQWPAYVRLPLMEATTSRAGALAWEHGLRGYDAVHLATTVLWQEALGTKVTLASFDTQLLAVAAAIGMNVLPDEGAEPVVAAD